MNAPKPTLRAPRTRGWTCLRGLPDGNLDESPAHAGMDRPVRGCTSPRLREPRARGDGPARTTPGATQPVRAPRTRGWTERFAGGAGDGCESPAHAGMDRHRGMAQGRARREPRARGDGPLASGLRRPLGWRAPRTRGWTVLSGGSQRPVSTQENPARWGMATHTPPAPRPLNTDTG